MSYSDPLNNNPLSDDIVDYIRLRPGMYIGDTQVRGMLRLFEDIFRFAAKHVKNWKTARLFLDDKGTYTLNIEGNLADNWDWNLIHISSMTYDRDFYGLVQLIALTSSIQIQTKNYNRHYINGKLSSTNRLTAQQSFSLVFELDKTIFKQQHTISLSLLTPMLERFCSFHPSKGIFLKSAQVDACLYSQGLVDLFSKMATPYELLSHPIRIQFEHQVSQLKVNIVLAFRSGYDDMPFVHLYANQELMLEGGTPVNGFLKGWRDACGKIIQDKNAFLNHRINLIALISIESPNVSYAGSVKQKVNNPNWLETMAQLSKEALLDSSTFIAALHNLNIEN